RLVERGPVALYAAVLRLEPDPEAERLGRGLVAPVGRLDDQRLDRVVGHALGREVPVAVDLVVLREEALHVYAAGHVVVALDGVDGGRVLPGRAERQRGRAVGAVRVLGVGDGDRLRRVPVGGGEGQRRR